jgi:hypothetical protein
MTPTGSEERAARCPECGHEMSGSRYCERCGAPASRALVRGSSGLARAGDLEPVRAGGADLRVEVDASRVLQQHATGVLELRLTNASGPGVQLAMVELETAVVDEPLRSLVRNLPRGGHAPVRFSIIPARHGDGICRVRVKALDVAQTFTVCRGEFALTVNPPHVEETTLQFVIQNSDVVGDFENVFAPQRPRPRAVVQPRHRALWVAVPLVEEERREVRPVPKCFAGPERHAGVPPIESAALRVPYQDEARTVALFAKPKLAFGRSAVPDPASGERNDVVLRLMPETAARQELSRRIHRFAFQLQTGPEGVQLLRLGRREGRVAVESVEPLRDGEPIDVAGLFHLVPRIIKGPDYLRWQSLRLHRKTSVAPEIELVEVCVPSAEQVLGVVLSRTDEAAEREQYVQVCRFVTIGASDEAAIVVREPGVSGLHARLIAKAGIFFIEDLGSTHGTWVNERRLQADEVEALQYGDRIVLGKTAVAFEPFEQHQAEGDP